ncbi:MAG: exodeoxyribonuclease large subunit, partial [Chloroflexota bacterium]|nr:exodeoxyribonuclease large subunit [Chloroflexota bacterium]
MSSAKSSDEQAWLPFEDFLASGAKPPTEGSGAAPRGKAAGASPGAPATAGEPGAAPNASAGPSSGASGAVPSPRILSVGDLTRLVRQTIQDAPGLRDVWVEGEVGQVSVSSAGHCYFTLKDERAQLRCMIFRDDRLAIPFQPLTGLRLVAHGRLDLFEPQGTYQLYVDTLQPSGFGDLALRFEALKAKLAAEGLFDAKRRRPLPPQPRVIGIATSLSGAVLHDMRKVLGRRWPLVRVVVSACQVQGAGAAESVVAALRRLSRWTDPETGRATDVVILARGGGSLEDLWAFNEEIVVRAVAAHPCPIVVGVGHETDVTLADFAADVRAATPSVAAELVVPVRAEELARVRQIRQALDARMVTTLLAAGRTLETERRALDGFRPSAYLAAERERVGLLLDRGARAIQARMEADRARLTRSGDRLPMLLQGRLARGRT